MRHWHAHSEEHRRRMSEDGPGPDSQYRTSPEEEAQAEIGLSATALWIVEWAGERHIRRRRDDRSYGHPDAHWAEQWGVSCQP